MSGGRGVAGRLGLLAVLAGFAVGLFWVFGLQFQGGMTYPEGSTLRADAEGAMILFESLERWPGVEAVRLLDPLHRLEADAAGVTLVVLNADGALGRYRPLVEFVQAGGRVVMQPRRVRQEEQKEEEEEEEETDAEAAEEGFWEGDEWLAEETPGLRGLLRVKRSWLGEETVAVRVEAGAGAPGSVEWGDGDVFELGRGVAAHRVLYAAEGEPAVLGVEDGAGQWVLLGDAVPLRNRAMFGAVPSEWLVWVLGGRETVVFWEYPMGIRQPRGVMTLMREYGLMPLLGVMGLVFVLWVWQGAVPMLPVVAEEEEPVRGEQTRLEGLRDLLRRYVPADAVLGRCVEEWRRDLPRAGGNGERRAALEAEARRMAAEVLPRRNRGARVRQIYASLQDVLNPKKVKR